MKYLCKKNSYHHEDNTTLLFKEGELYELKSIDETISDERTYYLFDCEYNKFSEQTFYLNSNIYDEHYVWDIFFNIDIMRIKKLESL